MQPTRQKRRKEAGLTSCRHCGRGRGRRCVAGGHAVNTASQSIRIPIVFLKVLLYRVPEFQVSCLANVSEPVSLWCTRWGGSRVTTSVNALHQPRASSATCWGGGGLHALFNSLTADEGAPPALRAAPRAPRAPRPEGQADPGGLSPRQGCSAYTACITRVYFPGVEMPHFTSI